MNNNSILMLEKMKQIIQTTPLKSEDEDTIKDTFKKILSSGDNYNLSEIENWLNVVTQTKSVTERIMNIAHYQKTKHEASNKLKMMPDDCGCGGDC